MSDQLDRLLDDALKAMNDTIVLAAEQGSPAAIDFLANWLDDRGLVDEEAADRVEALIGDGAFPPELTEYVCPTCARTVLMFPSPSPALCPHPGTPHDREDPTPFTQADKEKST